MKHLPNLLTLANLVCGCIAIAFILNSQPYLTSFNGNEYWVTGTEQAYWGAYFILFAGIFDVLDGLAARALQVFSPIGKDLDSLADVVSFGVAPSMILFKMLWATLMAEPYAFDVNMLSLVPAFIFVCAGALRLARFNNNNSAQKNYFIGMPIPAAGLFIATFPLVNWHNPEMGIYLQNKWVLYVVITVLSLLMVSRISFIKLVPAKWNMRNIWPQTILLIASIAGAIAIVSYNMYIVIPAVFTLYIILSFIYKPAEEAQTTD